MSEANAGVKLRYKILGTLLCVVVVGLLALGIWVSHDSACGPAPLLGADATPMKAIASLCYGPPEVLKYQDLEKPSPADNEVLLKIHAASVNPLDWHFMRGTPYLVRMEAGIGAPKDPKLGADVAGTIEAVGKNVKQFKPGDEVFGTANGSFAQYVSIPENDALVLKPAAVSFEQAASVPIAAITALQALRDKGQLQPGQKVLINGASGGVGTFAVQIAKALGAEVTGVCSTRNADMVHAIGADHVIDYSRENFINSGQRYDLIIDIVGNHSLLEYRRVLTPKGRLVITGSNANIGNWIGFLITPLEALTLSKFVNQKFLPFLAHMNKADLTILGELMQAGKVTPVIDRRYSLSQVPEAIRYLEQGHARGKIVINID